MCPTMLLTTSDAKKKSAPKNCSDMELDSLENYEDCENTELKMLNLNGLCKNKLDGNYTDELIIPERSVQSLSDLQVLNLRSNALHIFPNCILQLSSLITLDLSDNNILTIPMEINRLISLQELALDQNVLNVLPCTIWDLKVLRCLRIAYNRLAVPPDRFEMKALTLTEDEKSGETQSKSNILTNLNLRANRLKGNIILGNYGNLRELDVSENNIENLDLGAVEHLQSLQCSKNSIAILTLHGKVLTSLIVGNNRLKNIVLRFLPTSLRHIDVSYNELDTLPDWLATCQELRTVFASNNLIKSLPDDFFSNEMPYLCTLQLAYNQLHQLPEVQRKLPIQELFLQNNSLSTLPDRFFNHLQDLVVLNISNNRLCELPRPGVNLRLEKMLATANCLTDEALHAIIPHCRNLKVLHAAYNNFTSFPESCASHCREIEEIVLSGNKLLSLPDNIASLKHLAVLRIHSNLLQSCPGLSSLTSLRVLDLAHNHLDKINLTTLIPPNLKFLDLSCNLKLHVDSQQFNTYRSQRPMSLVDVSGKNRTSLPLTPSPFCESDLTDCSWTVGFSEASGCKQRLHISQIRLPAFCNTEALFGMFDGESNSDVPVAVDKIVPRILLEERTVKETANDYMKYTMLSTYKELREKGHKPGINAVIVHILKSKASIDYSFCGGIKKYVMKIASVGEVKVVLGRTVGPIRTIPFRQRKQIRINPQVNSVIPDPEIIDIPLEDKEEYMIIANKNLWDVISPESAIREVSFQRNVILAAKRLQDLAQSYGAEENLSIIVVRFNLVSSDVDLLMRELRQTIKKNKCYSESGLSNASTCQVGCCCEVLNNACSTCLDKIPVPPPMFSNNDDRSSPSGQSDHACSDCNSSAKLYIQQLNKQNETKSDAKAAPERRSYRGVAKALRARKEEEKNREDSDSALSEEQFKCWEYMLEQNTQLLFDKELNTLKRPLSVKNQTLSRSNPHLVDNASQQNSFLSKQFGSTRSFNPIIARPLSRCIPEKKLIGGPHAAYFGSLQRLMPYNLEYDFAVMQERGLADSLDLDRMQQYWGVATTEL